MIDTKKIKKEMLKSEKILGKHACRSKDAIREQEQDEDIRLEFARDVDKIIHSSCYTRYMSKTQVFVEPLNDHISTRMTHVQYVSKAARTIARALRLNEDFKELPEGIVQNSNMTVFRTYFDEFGFYDLKAFIIIFNINHQIQL